MADHPQSGGRWRWKKRKARPKKRRVALRLQELLSCPSGWEAGPILLALGIPGENSDSTQDTMNPADEPQPPIAGIQANDARTGVKEAHGPLQEGLSKGRIVDIGWREEEEHRQA
jgi:hypothetical protein